MKQFLFCICLVISPLPQVALASETGAQAIIYFPKGCSDLSVKQKHAIYAAVLTAAGMSAIVGTYFGTLQHRCPIFNSYGFPTSYTAPLYCCNGTELVDCDLASGSCPQKFFPACFVPPKLDDNQRVYQPAHEFPSENVGAKAGFAFGGVSLILGVCFFMSALGASLCSDCEQCKLES